MSEFLEVALGIGRTLCERAFWDRAGLRCNWMGRSPTELSRDGRTLTPTTTALGPELYGGSAGVGLFLAQLFAMTAEPLFRRSALGAINRSLCQIDKTPDLNGSSLSFFNGAFGVAFVADRIANLTGQTDLHGRIDGFVDRAADAIKAPHLLDLIGGNAGAIPALLAMNRPGGRVLANTLGEELVRRAERQGEKVVWDPATASGPEFGTTPLSGLSHGAAGMGLALFELHAATGRGDFLDAALGAFAYEDSLFEPHKGNWPDLRFETSRTMTAWCHGAPGIALSRLRAAAIDPERRESHLLTARWALATTRLAIENRDPASRADATLCHGLAGLVEVVLIGGRALNDGSYRDLAAFVARQMIDRHAAAGDWPSGLPSGGPNPSLFVGMAGIGYLFLRLHDPEIVPSVLITAAPD